jgi:NAD(P)-dependent dehydrogenase (short-subunit alcohol dehydrogenase family)
VKTTLLESWTGTPLRTNVVRRDVGTRKSENAVSCDYVAPPGRGSEVTCVLKHCPGLIRAHCGAAAYSASKAALNQLARVAALEWGEEGIRINSLHPDAVFDTGIWTEEVLAARAEHYGMTVQQYKTKNLLKTEVSSRDVAELAAEMCGPLFAKTTAAQVPVDGGNDRVV